MPKKQSSKNDAEMIETADGGKAYSFPLDKNSINYSVVDGKRLRSQTYHGMMKKCDYNWIQTTFKKKRCLKYIPTEKDRNKCCCGRSRNFHGPPEAVTDENISQNSICKWYPTEHVEENRTNAFGEVEFQGAGKKTRAKYIRVSNTTNPDDALKLLRKIWNLDYPQLLISVTGGAKSFKLSPKLKAHFTNGLLKVVQTTCTWVVTGGTNTGVMKHVGEALQSSTATNVYRIGVATWGIVNNRKELTKRKDGGPVNYSVGGSYNTIGAALDNNHTHFFLVDDGKINKYGGEIEFRGKLERSICNMNIEKNRVDRNVPGVQLVLEGGPNTISTVLAALSQHPPMPVVVVKGSGRAADLLATAHKLSRGEGPLFEMEDVVEHTNLLNKIEKVFAGMSKQEYQKIYQELLQCVERKNLITIHKMEDSDCHIDKAILKAFMKGTYVRPFDQLDLAMLWNRIDIAKEIFAGDTKWKVEDLHTSMHNALRRNRPKFVELLLENGVVVGKYLTVDRLEALFNSRYEESDNMLKLLFEKIKTKSSGGTIKLQNVSQVLKKIASGILIRNEEYGRCGTILNKAVMSRHKEAFINPFNELLIWAVLCNMNEMATMLWTQGEEPIAKALVVRKLYQAMASIAVKSHKQDDIIVAFENEAKKFGMLAIHLLNEAYRVNEKLAGHLVTHSLDNWGGETCLSLAVASQHLEFVAHPCCQELLSVKWTGEIQFTGKQFHQVLFGFILPPLVLMFKYKPLKEYRLVLMTETEHNQIEEEVKEEKKLLAKTKSNQIQEEKEKEKQKGDNRTVGFSSLSPDSIELISFNKSAAYTFSSNDHIIEKSREKTWYQKFASFYKAPVTKFVANEVVYCFFLGLYIFVITTKLQPKPFPTEWLLVVMVFSYTTEELRQLLESEQHSFVNKFREWASSYWNLCDALAIVLFFVAFGFRINDDTRVVGHVIYAVDIIFWIIRFLDIFAVNKHIGPYIVMIWKMTIDMINFLLVLVVFMVAYGVSRYTILNPEKERSWETLGEILFVPYFQIFGELFLDYPRENGTTIFRSKDNSYEHIEGLVAIIMAIYLLIANILLVNLLIAIFNNTYITVKANSNVIWRFQRYQQITEYSTRPILVPPFSIIMNVYQLVVAVCHFCQGKRGGKRVDRKLKAFLSLDQRHDVMLFEERCLASFLRQKDAIMLATQEEKLRVISERVDGISSMMESYTADGEAGGGSALKNDKKIEERFEKLESLMQTLDTRMSEIVNALHSGGNFGRRMSLGRLRSTDNRYGQSVSESPILEEDLHSVGSGLHPSPLMNRKSRKPSVISNISDTSGSGLYPNRNKERTGVVKRAVYNFRKGSLKSNAEKLPMFQRSISFAVSNTKESESKVIIPRQRRMTFPSNEVTSTKPYCNNNNKDNAEASECGVVEPQTTDDGGISDIPSSQDDRNISSVVAGTSSCIPIDHDVDNGYDYVDAPDYCDVAEQRSFYDRNVSEGRNLYDRDVSLRRNASDLDVFQRRDVSGIDGVYSDYCDVNVVIDGSESFSDDNSDVDDAGMFIHTWSRCTIYPFSYIKRCPVANELVDWKEPMPSYTPPAYISPTVSSYLPWVDPEPTNEKFDLIKFNAMDGKINRKSFHGDYDVIDRLPRNPIGRTGITDRGLLCRYGPNHIQNVLFTKWKKNKNNGCNSDQLEILMVSHINGKISIPGGPCEDCSSLPVELKHLFSANTLESCGMSVEKQKLYVEKMERIINERELIFQHYMDNERNTDNAWIEASVYNYHDNDGEVIDRFIQNDSSVLRLPGDKVYEWRGATAETAHLLPEERSTHFLLKWMKCVASNKNVNFG